MVPDKPFNIVNQLAVLEGKIYLARASSEPLAEWLGRARSKYSAVVAFSQERDDRRYLSELGDLLSVTKDQINLYFAACQQARCWLDKARFVELCNHANRSPKDSTLFLKTEGDQISRVVSKLMIDPILIASFSLLKDRTLVTEFLGQHTVMYQEVRNASEHKGAILL